MLFFYIRHGDPIYSPDSLTPLGERQAAALAKRLALYGVDQIYASTSNRAILTAQPTCELLKKEMTLLDFANENYAWRDLSVTDANGRRTWLFDNADAMATLTDKELKNLGFRWYEHPHFSQYSFRDGMERIAGESDAFFRSLGYEHIRETGTYKVLKPNNERVALFAHAGFGIAFLSLLLDIPYPDFSAHFDLCHSGMTVIEFRENNGCAIPRILTLSSDSHLYREGLPTNYCGRVWF